MVNKKKVGIIGLGVGEKHIKEFRRSKSVIVDTICDFNKYKMQSIKKKYKIKNIAKKASEIINNKSIEIVSIASYDNFHSDQIIQSIKKNKSIFVEKPLCLNFNQFRKITYLLRKYKKTKISSNFVLRNLDVFNKIKKKIKLNKFGKIYNIEAEYNYGRKHKITNGWRGKIPFYSVMHGGGLHLIDLIQWLTNLKIVKVFSISNKIATKNSKFRHPDNITSLLMFDNGCIGKISSNFSIIGPHHHQLRIAGTKRSFFYNQDGAKEYSSIGKKKFNQINYKKEKYEKFKSNKVLKSFIQHVLFNKKLIVQKREILNSMNVSLSIDKSLRKKKWIKIYN